MSLSLLNRTQIKGEFYKAFDADYFGAMLNSLATRTTSTGDSDTYGFADGPGPAREWVGNRVFLEMVARQISITNKKWESSVHIARERWEQDQTGEIQRKMPQLASMTAAKPWDLMRDLITNGGTGTAYDGQAFFSASHSLGSSGTQSNLLTNSDLSILNVAAATSVATAEEAANIMIALISRMRRYLNEHGKPLNAGAKGFMFVVHGDQYPAFFTAAKANNLAGGATNPNPLLDATIDVQMDPEATTATQVHVFRTDATHMRPFILQVRDEIEVDALGPGSDYYFQKDGIAVGTRWRGNVGYGEPLTAIRATLS